MLAALEIKLWHLYWVIEVFKGPIRPKVDDEIVGVATVWSHTIYYLFLPKQ